MRMSRLEIQRAAIAAVVMACASLPGVRAQSAVPDTGEAAFRALYKELIEINTTRSVGDCTRAAEAMRAHLRAAGYPEEDMQILAPPEAPKDGALIAVLRAGTSPSSRSCCSRTSTLSKPSARTGRAIPSR